MRTAGRTLALYLALQLLLLPVLSPVLAAGDASPTHGTTAHTRISQRVHGKAGGWGIATPILIAGVGLYEHIAHDEEFTVDTLVNREVIGGILGDFATVMVFSKLLPMLPLPPVISQTLMIAAGFIGWEIGSGNLPNTDWVGLSAQVATATAIQVGMHAVALGTGVALGGIPTLIASMAGAIAVGILLDRLREGADATAPERPALRPSDPTATLKASDGPLPPGFEPYGVDSPERGSLYQRLKESLSDGDRARSEALWQQYRGLDVAPAASH